MRTVGLVLVCWLVVSFALAPLIAQWIGRAK